MRAGGPPLINQELRLSKDSWSGPPRDPQNLWQGTGQDHARTSWRGGLAGAAQEPAMREFACTAPQTKSLRTLLRRFCGIIRSRIHMDISQEQFHAGIYSQNAVPKIRTYPRLRPSTSLRNGHANRHLLQKMSGPRERTLI